MTTIFVLNCLHWTNRKWSPLFTGLWSVRNTGKAYIGTSRKTSISTCHPVTLELTSSKIIFERENSQPMTWHLINWILISFCLKIPLILLHKTIYLRPILTFLSISSIQIYNIGYALVILRILLFKQVCYTVYPGTCTENYVPGSLVKEKMDFISPSHKSRFRIQPVHHNCISMPLYIYITCTYALHAHVYTLACNLLVYSCDNSILLFGKKEN